MVNGLRTNKHLESFGLGARHLYMVDVAMPLVQEQVALQQLS